MDSSLFQFISEHENDDVSRLLLSRGKWPDIDMDLAVNTIEGRKRIAAKVPQWGERHDLLYPTRLCTEQCSSEATAQYKASIARRMGWKSLADLTGGLGVDSWYLASAVPAILHNEADPVLAAGVRENFRVLGRADHINFRNALAEPGKIREILGDFVPDVVFMDPARRSESGKKVFLIEDCRPDVLGLRDEIFGICRWIFLKLSPMADISMAVGRLGHVTEVHTVATGGECKELLVIMDREHRDSGYRLFVHDSGQTLEFDPEAEKAAVPVLPGKASADGSADRMVTDGSDRMAAGSADRMVTDGVGNPLADGAGWVGQTLFEPGKALGKAGVSNSLCDRFALVKIGRSTNLYLAGGAGIQDPDTPPSTDEPLSPGAPTGSEFGSLPPIASFGKAYTITEVHPLDKRSMKEVGDRLGWADVTARNIPMTSEELGKKMGLSPKKAKKTAGNDGLRQDAVPHIFGVRADWKDAPGKNLLIVAWPVRKP